MQYLEVMISFICGIFVIALILYARWAHNTIVFIKEQVSENARGISVGIENQELLSKMMLEIVKEFKESTSYQYRVMEEFMESYFKGREGEQHNE